MPYTNHTTVSFDDYFAAEVTCLRDLIGQKDLYHDQASTALALSYTTPCHERTDDTIGWNVLYDASTISAHDILVPTQRTWQYAHLYGFMHYVTSTLWGKGNTSAFVLLGVNEELDCWSKTSSVWDAQLQIAHDASHGSSDEMYQMIQHMTGITNHVWYPYFMDVMHGCTSDTYVNVYITSVVMVIGFLALICFTCMLAKDKKYHLLPTT